MRAWYRRWRTLLGEVWRFGIVGATNVGINFAVFNALVIVLFAGSELKANLLATAFATTSSYLMNRAWTFRHRKTARISREYVLFFLFNAAGLGIELGVMGAVKYGLGWDSLVLLNLAKLLGLTLGTVFRFWTYRTFVFAGSSAAPAVTAGTPPVAAGTAADPGPAAVEGRPAAAPAARTAPAGPDHRPSAAGAVDTLRVAGTAQAGALANPRQ